MTDEFTDIVKINLGFSILFLFHSLYAIYLIITHDFRSHIYIDSKVVLWINILLVLFYLLSIVFDSIYLRTNKNIWNMTDLDIFILTLVEIAYNFFLLFFIDTIISDSF